jgi:membrane-associated protease RseP (regulator of RpoE activity)
MAGTVAQVAFFVALIVVIVIHEAAHFGVAKWFGIKVEEFFVGFGPRLWSFRRGETEYGIKAIPAGGYVKIAGMNPYQETPEEELPRTFGAKPIWQRALVIVAGPATHFVLAYICFAVWLGVVGEVTGVAADPVISQVARTLEGGPSPALEAGLRSGDRVVEIDGIDHPTSDELIQYTRSHVGTPVTLRVRREGREQTLTVTPVLSTVEGERVGRIGVTLTAQLIRDRQDIIGSITGGARLVGSNVVGIVKGLGSIFSPEGISRTARLLFTDAPRTARDPLSVVGAGRVAAQTAASGPFWNILYIFGSLNLVIGLLNLLPLPPFDGGHLAILVIEKARGKKVDMRKVVPISVAVASFFILITVAYLYLDIAKPLNLSP